MNEELQNNIEQRGPIQTIGVIGMGYVGIPAAVLFANVPSVKMVYGLQRNSPSSGYKIPMLNAGELPLKGEEPDLPGLLKDVVSAKRFRCTDDFSLISSCDAVTIAIQTPFLNPQDLIPDFSALEEGIRQAGRYLTKGTLVVLESTITPGTTIGIARNILEKESGFIAGKDFALAHAPERVMVGRLIQNIQEHDRIVGGIDETSTRRARELYAMVLTKGRVIPMTSTAAEVTKTAENTFRDLQIAAANQLALYCEAIGVNFYDVRNGIDSLKGEGITRAILWPGAGVGGHCLTKDTYHLERGVRTSGGESLDYPSGTESLFVTARRINDFMPDHMFHLLEVGLNRIHKEVRGSKIALLGWAFLANTDDARNSPSEIFYRRCLEAEAEVRVHDPWVTKWQGVTISSSLDETITRADVVVIFTGHREYHSLEPLYIRNRTGADHPVIIDGRNLLNPDRFIEAGFVYKGIGRGDKNNHPIIS
ncbi:MAG: nucleotide sugar dehydrogenase [Methanospirillum sp.]|uniref:nucleotide sugar dehydrogenase n=1 Tax=Methanospirillum sp. TaxID=45200 RepID=UPI00236FD8E2|nr:nucleotide sugar dehydrogenase [Methanospirillum sp.]MDD1729844.1 nucleotide sugar dehydrogenase [Methanospirillum sp.]